ncbi:carbonic anhydrase [Clostridium sporogenes]|uniref:carbonic anhydrase n=1 Tax=Clostridium sporogenes TaxID=1509 RepID=UPI002AA29C39|nr:carbonic anhydrase [Clostridium sporogenes]
MKKRFGTVLNCIDGRVQIPVTNWLKESFDVDYVDLITEPGIDKVLSQGQWLEIERLREKVIISITAHNSNVVAVVGHYDCAANPVSDCRHFQEIVVSTYVVKSWRLPVRVVGLWVDAFLCVHVVSI